MKRLLIFFGGVALVLALLNPNMEDFSAYIENEVKTEATQDVNDDLKPLAELLAGGTARTFVNLGYTRSNYGIASVFYLGTKDNPRKRFLGFGKQFFIALDD